MMAQWRVKEISNLTKISVRMLHHYDKIGLLKPSMRSANGYRWYSEPDLAKMQQIIALKFFGFSLSQIKTMLQQKPSIQEHLLTQKQILKEQTENLQQAQDALDVILERYSTAKSLDWNDLITLIERYRMAKELKKTWAGKLNKKQQANYISFKQKYPKETDAWDAVIAQINNKEFGDPEGPDGEFVVKVFSELSKAGTKLGKTKPSKKMTQTEASDLLDHIDKCQAEGIPLSPEGNMWFAKAVIANKLRCWMRLLKEITKNLDADPESVVGQKLATQWRELISDNCIGGGPKDFHFGRTLLMNAFRDKIELQKPTERTPEQNQQMMQDAKTLRNPMAWSWIVKALEKH